MAFFSLEKDKGVSNVHRGTMITPPDLRRVQNIPEKPMIPIQDNRVIQVCSEAINSVFTLSELSRMCRCVEDDVRLAFRENDVAEVWWQSIFFLLSGLTIPDAVSDTRHFR